MSKAKLMRKVNDTLGKDILVALYSQLTDAEYNQFQTLLLTGKIALHNDGYLGFSADTKHGWTSEGFTI
jgi:hypothetical protein